MMKEDEVRKILQTCIKAQSYSICIRVVGSGKILVSKIRYC